MLSGLPEEFNRENTPPEEVIHKNEEGTDTSDILDMTLGSLAEKIKGVDKEKDDVKFSNMVIDGKALAHVKAKFLDHRVRVTDEIPQPVTVIRLGGKSIATMGDISTVTGKAKARKSYFLSAVITAALNPHYYQGSLDVVIPQHRNKIIWIDTEQSEYWSQQILFRVKRSGVSIEEIDDRLIYLNCRNLNADQLKAITYFAIDKYHDHASICIIDGSRDLVKSINDEDEAVNLSRWLPEIAEHYNINITNVLHQNPGGGEGSKLRGTIGTELMNKSEFVVEIKKSENDKDVFSASSMLSRDIETDDLFFSIEDGLLEFTDKPSDSRSEKTRFMANLDIAELKSLTKKIFFTNPEFSTNNFIMALQEQLRENFDMHVGVQTLQKSWVPYLENKGLIQGEKKGRKNIYTKSAFADSETAPF